MQKGGDVPRLWRGTGMFRQAKRYWEGIPGRKGAKGSQENACVVFDSFNPMNCSLPGFSVHEVFPGKILEWVGISSSRGSSWPRDWTRVSGVSCSGRRFFTHCVIWEAWKMSGAVKTRGIFRDHLEELKEQLPKTEAKWGFLPMTCRATDEKKHRIYQVPRHHVTTANSIDEPWQLE